MNKKTLNKSQRKFVAREKARIRRQFFDLEKQKEEIEKIAQRFFGKIENSQAETIKNQAKNKDKIQINKRELKKVRITKKNTKHRAQNTNKTQSPKHKAQMDLKI